MGAERSGGGKPSRESRNSRCARTMPCWWSTCRLISSPAGSCHCRQFRSSLRAGPAPAGRHLRDRQDKAARSRCLFRIFRYRSGGAAEGGGGPARVRRRPGHRLLCAADGARRAACRLCSLRAAGRGAAARGTAGRDTAGKPAAAADPRCLKAVRCVFAAQGRLLVDFGLRRTHGAEAGLLSARASYLAGFDGTATVLAGMRWGGAVRHDGPLVYPLSWRRIGRLRAFRVRIRKARRC